jgi:hypothetical protein
LNLFAKFAKRTCDVAAQDNCENKFSRAANASPTGISRGQEAQAGWRSAENKPILPILGLRWRDQPMDKSVFLGAAAALTLAASGALAAPDTVLWNQNANFGGPVFSENSDTAADDFTVPSGQTWHVSEVDVTGAYFNSSGPAASEVVTFYTDRRGKPGRVYRGPFTLNCTDNNGSFQCILPERVKLRSGTWWVSLVANCDFETCGEWGWTENTTVQGNEAVWEGPDGNGKCTSFKPLHRCFGGAPADLAFDLVGTAATSN